MKRKIIEIDEALCNGCGQCVDACAEGAIQLVNGIAKVMRDDYCDGLGACIGDCPVGALHIIEREAAEYDPTTTEAHIRATRGEEGLTRFLEQQEAEEHPVEPPLPPTSGCQSSSKDHQHGANHQHGEHGCVCGSQPQILKHADAAPAISSAIARPAAPQLASLLSAPPSQTTTTPPPGSTPALPPRINTPDLGQWPVQLHLVPLNAPFFANKELVVLSTCSLVASADIHWRFLRGRSCVIACPKLDQTDPYVDKLAAILATNPIPSLQVVRMLVPCCSGLTRLVLAAARQSGRTDLIIDEFVIGMDGSVDETRRLAYIPTA